MAFNISDFKTHVNNKNVVHPSHFMVRFYPPAQIFQGFSDTVRNLEFWGESTQLPMYQIGGHQMQRFGYGSVEVRPTIPQYRDFVITFICDAKGEIWRFFKEWQRRIIENTLNGTKAIYELSYKEEYLADVDIDVFPRVAEQANTAPNPIMRAKLINAFPMHLGAVSLDWGAQNQYARLPVILTYTDWVETL
jgi:hypothetical protein